MSPSKEAPDSLAPAYHALSCTLPCVYCIYLIYFLYGGGGVRRSKHVRPRVPESRPKVSNGASGVAKRRDPHALMQSCAKRETHANPTFPVISARRSKTRSPLGSGNGAAREKGRSPRCPKRILIRTATRLHRTLQFCTGCTYPVPVSFARLAESATV